MLFHAWLKIGSVIFTTYSYYEVIMKQAYQTLLINYWHIVIVLLDGSVERA
jgi:hypothetical protein